LSSQARVARNESRPRKDLSVNIAIIGTGNVGKALGSSFSRVGHHVIYGTHTARPTDTAALTTGGSAALSLAEAARAADIVVIAVPYVSAGREVAEAIAPEVKGKVVIDATNPIKADYSGLATEGGPSGAENFASWLPGARVVKAFNTIFASVQADPSTLGVKVDALYATDDDRASVEVSELLSSIGFRPVYVGPLARARELEAIANLNIHLQIETKGDWRTSINFVGAPEASTTLPK
jgi:predicted dinucleotide-binding enzyme